MEGVFPVFIDGVLSGKLRVRGEGSMTLFDAECRFQPGIIRLSVYGGGEEGYLGVLTPEGELLTLHRRLSRSALRGFPREIDHAERAGQTFGTDDPGQTSAAPEPMPTQPETACDIPEDTAGLYWYSSPEGVLVCFDGECSLIALPREDERAPANAGALRVIEGREYRVFRMRRGRIVY